MQIPSTTPHTAAIATIHVAKRRKSSRTFWSSLWTVYADMLGSAKIKIITSVQIEATMSKETGKARKNSSRGIGKKCLDVGVFTRAMPSNVPDQRPGATDPQLSTRASSPGSLHLACYVSRYPLMYINEISNQQTLVNPDFVPLRPEAAKHVCKLNVGRGLSLDISIRERNDHVALVYVELSILWNRLESVLQEYRVWNTNVILEINATLVFHETRVLQMGIAFVGKDSPIAKQRPECMRYRPLFVLKRNAQWERNEN